MRILVCCEASSLRKAPPSQTQVGLRGSDRCSLSEGKCLLDEQTALRPPCSTLPSIALHSLRQRPKADSLPPRLHY